MVMPSTPIAVTVSKKSATRFGFGIVEEGAVDGDAKALRLGELQRGHRLVVDALAADRAVVHLLVAVEMDRPGEVGARLVFVDLLLEQQRVGADDDEAASARSARARSSAAPCGSAARRRRSTRPARRIPRRRRARPRPRCACSGSRPDSRSCRSRRRRDCSGTAAPASAPADSACGPARCWRTM